MHVTSKLPRVGTTISTVMSQLAAQRQAVNLGQGFPDFEGPASCTKRCTVTRGRGTISTRP
jgi:hypothetical protein